MAGRRTAAGSGSTATRTAPRVAVGVAGWSIAAQAEAFPRDGSHLQRYAAVFPVVEINSSFYRPHRTATYARWSASVPTTFRFSVKLPKTITHDLRLRGALPTLDAFLAEVGGLGSRLGCLLIQLPPSLVFDAAVVNRFLTGFRARHDGAIAIEPRHASWFEDSAEQSLLRHRIARVAADPAVVAAAAEPGGATALTYYRMHGSPHMYYTPYGKQRIDALVAAISRLSRRGRDVWCIFDNTAYGAAIGDALLMRDRVRR